MAKFITVNVIKSATRRPNPDWYRDNEEGEGAPVDPAAAATEEVQSVPRRVNLADIAFYQPRKDGMVGTRFTRISGRGFAVTETFDEVVALERSALDA